MAKIYIPTVGEERANAVSHGVIAILLLLAIPFASAWSYAQWGSGVAISVSIYAISIFAMMLVSTLYHMMPPGSRHKEVLHLMDHIFIYVAIAGTYTPVAICVIGGWQGVLVAIVQWVMVIFGIFYKIFAKRSIPAVSLSIYLIMGWLVVAFFHALIDNATTQFLILLGGGGVFYSVGAVIYARKGFKYHHLVWHLFINVAIVLHLIAIVFYL